MSDVATRMAEIKEDLMALKRQLLNVRSAGSGNPNVIADIKREIAKLEMELATLQGARRVGF